MRVDVLVVPNARRSEIVGIHGDRIKVRLASPPEKNKANKALIALFATTFGIRRVEIVAGRTNRWKTVELVGASVDQVEAVIRESESA